MQGAMAASDPLPSWTDYASKKAIVTEGVDNQKAYEAVDKEKATESVDLDKAREALGN
jgi:hypothetical protein